jgi:hypothetical protein
VVVEELVVVEEALLEVVEVVGVEVLLVVENGYDPSLPAHHPKLSSLHDAHPCL